MKTKSQFDFASWAHYVTQRTKAGKFIAIISGLGRNRGTLDAAHSAATARRHARRLRKSDPAHNYTVEGMVAK